MLRLSKNWLVGRLMTVYVEAFRNVPLLLWIIVVFVVTSETAPQPKDFKVTADMIQNGTEPAAQKILFDTIAITNRGWNVPAPLFERPLGVVHLGSVPVNLSFLAIVAVIAASIFVYRAIRRKARLVQEDTGVRPVTWWKSLLVMVVPTVALLLALGFHLEIPAVPTDENGVSKGFNFQGGILVMHSFTALLIALSLYTGAAMLQKSREVFIA